MNVPYYDYSPTVRREDRTRTYIVHPKPKSLLNVFPIDALSRLIRSRDRDSSFSGQQYKISGDSIPIKVTSDFPAVTRYSPNRPGGDLKIASIAIILSPSGDMFLTVSRDSRHDLLCIPQCFACNSSCDST